jgi:hypothetical protein
MVVAGSRRVDGMVDVLLFAQSVAFDQGTCRPFVGEIASVEYASA